VNRSVLQDGRREGGCRTGLFTPQGRIGVIVVLLEGSAGSRLLEDRGGETSRKGTQPSLRIVLGRQNRGVCLDRRPLRRLGWFGHRNAERETLFHGPWRCERGARLGLLVGELLTGFCRWGRGGAGSRVPKVGHRGGVSTYPRGMWLAGVNAIRRRNCIMREGQRQQRLRPMRTPAPGVASGTDVAEGLRVGGCRVRCLGAVVHRRHHRSSFTVLIQGWASGTLTTLVGLSQRATMFLGCEEPATSPYGCEA